MKKGKSVNTKKEIAPKCCNTGRDSEVIADPSCDEITLSGGHDPVKSKSQALSSPLECKYWLSCDAMCPICPIGIWYPDEDICHNRAFAKTALVRNQRSVARKAKNTDTYYTAGMLDRDIIIRSGIEGIDPNLDMLSAIRAEALWINKHPEKAPLAQERRDLLRNRMVALHEHNQKGRRPHSTHAGQKTAIAFSKKPID